MQSVQVTMMHGNAGSYARGKFTASSPVSSDSVAHPSSETDRTTSYSEESDDTTSEESEDNNDGRSEGNDAVVRTVGLTRRKNSYGVTVYAPAVRNAVAAGDAHTRDMCGVQDLWSSHAQAAGDMFPKSLWRVLSAVKNETKVLQTAVLKACKLMLPAHDRKRWPCSREMLDRAVTRKIGQFDARVTRTIRIDLSHHNIPTLREPISFSFLDPVYAWAFCARKLGTNHELHFEHVPLVDPITGERLYGAGVQHGDWMEEACHSRPGPPALFGLSYDAGQASRRRSYSPILISVGNTNYVGKHSCICIGYMPDLALGSYSNHPSSKAAMHELRQAIVRAITAVIEASAEHGFRCYLPAGVNSPTCVM